MFYFKHLVAQMVKCLPAMWETWVQSLGWEDALEKEMATHFTTLAWKIPCTEEPDRQQSMRLQRVRHDWATSLLLIMDVLRSLSSNSIIYTIWVCDWFFFLHIVDIFSSFLCLLILLLDNDIVILMLLSIWIWGRSLFKDYWF